jgi:hypothetical protein
VLSPHGPKPIFYQTLAELKAALNTLAPPTPSHQIFWITIVVTIGIIISSIAGVCSYHSGRYDARIDLLEDLHVLGAAEKQHAKIKKMWQEDIGRKRDTEQGYYHERFHENWDEEMGWERKCEVCERLGRKKTSGSVVMFRGCRR